MSTVHRGITHSHRGKSRPRGKGPGWSLEGGLSISLRGGLSLSRGQGQSNQALRHREPQRTPEIPPGFVSVF